MKLIRRLLVSVFSLYLMTMASALPASAQQLRIVQTNSRADVVHLIDPATQQIVQEISGIPVNHGAAVAPDGSELYFSSEAKLTLDVVDTSNFAIVHEIPLTARPNNISIGKDGRYVYVGIMAAPGGIDVVDTQHRAVVQHIDTGSNVHNTYVTPDGQHLVAGTFGGTGNLDVYSTATHERVFQLYPPRNDDTLEGIRPIAFDTNADGSTRNLYVQISELHGFAVVDFATRSEVARIELPSIPEPERDPPPYNAAPAHGIGVAPDQRTLWVCSRMNGRVYAYALPSLDYVGEVKVGSHPDWLTFTPDSRLVYVANGHSDDVSVVDIAGLREIARIPVAAAPKRNITALLP